MTKILLVEDEEKLARFVELELTHEGYQVEKIKIPTIKNHKPGRYKRPKDETREAVKDWYAKLWEKEDKRY